jgi:hypothetical protein
MARSRSVTGPCEGCPANPLLTHRHLGPELPVHCVGHADLLQMEDGSWRGCCLAERRVGGLSLCGRETWSVPVDWPGGGWPVFAPGAGKIEIRDPATPGPELEAAWIGLRQAPAERLDGPGTFLAAHPDPLALVGRRIREPAGRWEATLTPDAGAGAHGLALFSTDHNWLKLEREGSVLRLYGADGREYARTEVPPDGPLGFELVWSPEGADAAWSVDGRRTSLGAQVPAGTFSRPVFAGGVAALFAVGDAGGLEIQHRR